jgi:nucleoside-diphosphate-sugar epimerase
MKIIVTGGAGFIGSNLCDYLANDYDVTAIDNLSTGDLSNLSKNVNFISKDIRSLTAADFENVITVFHCAALARVQPSIKDPITYHDVNVNGTLNVLECAKKAGVNRVVFSSSSSVYGDAKIIPTNEKHQTAPISPYALHKLMCEQYCKLYSRIYGLDTVCLRYFNVYGEKMSTNPAYSTAISVFMQQKSNNLPLTITNEGNQKRDFTYVKDVVQANVAAMLHESSFNGECINIGSGTNYSINEISQAFNHITTYIGNVLEPFETLADNSKAKAILNWNPKQNVLQWIKRYYEQ